MLPYPQCIVSNQGVLQQTLDYSTLIHRLSTSIQSWDSISSTNPIVTSFQLLWILIQVTHSPRPPFCQYEVLSNMHPKYHFDQLSLVAAAWLHTDPPVTVPTVVLARFVTSHLNHISLKWMMHHSSGGLKHLAIRLCHKFAWGVCGSFDVHVPKCLSNVQGAHWIKGISALSCYVFSLDCTSRFHSFETFDVTCNLSIRNLCNLVTDHRVKWPLICSSRSVIAW